MTIEVLFILYFVSNPESESEPDSESEPESESEQPHHDSAPLLAIMIKVMLALLNITQADNVKFWILMKADN